MFALKTRCYVEELVKTDEIIKFCAYAFEIFIY